MAENKKESFSTRKRIRSFRFAFRGIQKALQEQHNLRIHLFAALIAIILGIIFHIDSMEWLIVIICISVVLAAELFNSAIEALTDLISPEYNKKAGMIKDIAAGAVLITAIGAAVTGVWIFLPKIIAIF